MCTERIVETAPRRYLTAHAADKWQFIETPRGFVAREWFDVNAFDAAERAAYEADEASLPPGIDEQQDGEMLYPPVWPTLALAKKWADFEDAYRSIGEDLDGYHAPSECYADAYRGYDARREALLAQRVVIE